jgi:hypothetical protein
VVVGIIIVVIILTLVSYVIVQETRAQMHWRGLVQQGDVDAISQLLEGEIATWRSARVPREVPPLLWHGVQTVELAEVSATGARVNCSVEGEYAFSNGRRIETTTPIAAAKRLTMKLSDMLLYEIPNVKLDHFQVDVYTSFRSEGGQADTRCIMSTLVERSVIETLDWEATSPDVFVALVGSRFADDASGAIEGVEPLVWRNGSEGSS